MFGIVSQKTLREREKAIPKGTISMKAFFVYV